MSDWTNKHRRWCIHHNYTFERLTREAVNIAQGQISFFSFYNRVTGISKREDLDFYIQQAKEVLEKQ